MPRTQTPQDQIHVQNCIEFCNDVETLVAESNTKADEVETTEGRKSPLRLSYIDAVLVIAERRKIEPDLAAAYINPQIKEKLRAEYESRHMLPKSARLPF